jgi:hypothetical protein
MHVDGVRKGHRDNPGSPQLSGPRSADEREMIMQRLRLRSQVTGIAGIAALLSLGFTFVAPAVQAGATNVAPCATASLGLRTGLVTTSTGRVAAEFGFVNHGAKSCSLRGYPHVQMLNKSGRYLKTTDHTAPGAFDIEVRTVVLTPGATAYFGILHHNQTGYANLTCPTSAALVFTPPQNTATITLRGSAARIEAFGGTTAHLVCGGVQVTPVTAKRFQ